MTHHAAVLDTWAKLPSKVRDLTAPIETEAQYHQVLERFEEVWNQVGKDADHPLGSLFVLLRDRLVVYEARVYPVDTAPPHRVLAFLMAQHHLRQAQLAATVAERFGEERSERDVPLTQGFMADLLGRVGAAIPGHRAR